MQHLPVLENYTLFSLHGHSLRDHLSLPGMTYLQMETSKITPRRYRHQGIHRRNRHRVPYARRCQHQQIILHESTLPARRVEPVMIESVLVKRVPQVQVTKTVIDMPRVLHPKSQGIASPQRSSDRQHLPLPPVFKHPVSRAQSRHPQSRVQEKNNPLQLLPPRVINRHIALHSQRVPRLFHCNCVTAHPASTLLPIPDKTIPPRLPGLTVPVISILQHPPAQHSRHHEQHPDRHVSLTPARAVRNPPHQVCTPHQ